MPKNTAPKGLPALFQPIDLTEGPCWKTILRFSFPIILSYLLQQVYSISDAAIVGQTLSGEQVAGQASQRIGFIQAGIPQGAADFEQMTLR